ncbi:MAG: cytochrome c [bacterium]|nr:cytochrome c [bacterium]
MKKFIIPSIFVFTLFVCMLFFQNCTASKEAIANKSGAQLWGENCLRCHNTPSPTDFNDTQWKTIGLHMQDRANLTKDEADKIVTFLQSAN